VWLPQAGVLDGAMVACDVDDMDWPLGFKISTQTMNLDVSYAVLRGMELHRTSGLFPPLDPSAPPTGPTEPPVFLDFGWDNTVREPTTMVLVIRNNTPITTRVALGLDRFGVEDEYGADGTQTLTPRSMGSSALQSPRGSVSFANRLPTGGGASSHAGSSMGGASGRMAMSTKGRRPALDNRNEEMQVTNNTARASAPRFRHEIEPARTPSTAAGALQWMHGTTPVSEHSTHIRSTVPVRMW
jgi:hypothetical protein